MRTSLVDTGAARPLCELLREEEDTVVKTTAVAAVSNLVLEFSPMRQVLIDQGCVPRICALVKSEDHTLRVNALWALKNGASAPSGGLLEGPLIPIVSYSELPKYTGVQAGPRQGARVGLPCRVS